MLPLITEEVREELLSSVLQEVNSWRKQMIHYIKEENPEINAAIIEAAESTNLDPKAIALGAYLTYVLLERAEKLESSTIEGFLE